MYNNFDNVVFSKKNLGNKIWSPVESMYPLQISFEVSFEHASIDDVIKSKKINETYLGKGKFVWDFM